MARPRPEAAGSALSFLCLLEGVALMIKSLAWWGCTAVLSLLARGPPQPQRSREGALGQAGRRKGAGPAEGQESPPASRDAEAHSPGQTPDPERRGHPESLAWGRGAAACGATAPIPLPSSTRSPARPGQCAAPDTGGGTSLTNGEPPQHLKGKETS